MTMGESQEGPTKEQINNDIRVSGRWLDALDTPTFRGCYAADIATLRSFIQTLHDEAKKMLDKMLEEAAGKYKPEFGRPVEAAK